MDGGIPGRDISGGNGVVQQDGPRPVQQFCSRYVQNLLHMCWYDHVVLSNVSCLKSTVLLPLDS